MGINQSDEFDPLKDQEVTPLKDQEVTPQDGLVNALKQAPIACPYPDSPRYLACWKTLTPEQQLHMAKHITISSDGKVEVDGVSYSLLQAPHNGVDIFAGETPDKNGNTGAKGVTYFSGDAAEKMCEQQGKALFADEGEVRTWVNIFPGSNPGQKINSIVTLFDLPLTGYWHPVYKIWNNVHSMMAVGYAMLSKATNNVPYGIRYDENNMSIDKFHTKFAHPYLVRDAA